MHAPHPYCSTPRIHEKKPRGEENLREYPWEHYTIRNLYMDTIPYNMVKIKHFLRAGKAPERKKA